MKKIQVSESKSRTLVAVIGEGGFGLYMRDVENPDLVRYIDGYNRIGKARPGPLESYLSNANRRGVYEGDTITIQF